MKHGLNTTLPSCFVELCETEQSEMVEFVRSGSPNIDISDIVYAIAARQRLRERRVELLDRLVSIDLSDPSAAGLSKLLVDLGRLETYERKSHSRWARLIADL